MTRKKIKAYTRLDGTSNDLGYEWTCIKRDQKGIKVCNKQFRTSIKEDQVIDRIKEELRRWKSDNTAQNLTTEYYFYQQINLSEDQKELIPEIKTQIQIIQSQINTNIELLSAGVITMETFKQFSEGKNIKLNELLHELQRITNLENEREEINHRRDQFIQQVRQLNVENLTNSTLKQIFTKIIVHRDENGVILIPAYNLGVEIDWQKVVEASKAELLAKYGY